jgi:4-amino-4-deoxy-L-arabinose transferase-like glycosyltransferase
LARVELRYATPIALYLAAVVLVLVRLGSHPPFAYNWENYTARSTLEFWDWPTGAIFRLTQGLMTDSGESPLVALPVWFGFSVGGVSVTSLRVPIALLSAGAIPLLWVIGRKMVGPASAGLTAVLLALSPVFLLYARSATSVGLSLVPALATAVALVMALTEARNWRWLVGLQVALIVSAYAYAPIRLMWPISLSLFGLEFLLRRDARRPLLRGGLVTLVVLPIAVMLLDTQPGWSPLDSMRTYYHGRGEHVFALREDPAEYASYVNLAPEELAELAPGASTWEIGRRLVARNTMDYINLLLDWETRPVITDYWNPHGRLYPMFLVPFFFLGLVRVGRRAPYRTEARALLVLFFGFSLPVLLTSQIQVGRLVFAVPWLFLLVATGFDGGVGAIRSVVQLTPGNSRGAESTWFADHSPTVILAWLVLFTLVLRSTWIDFRQAPVLTREEQTLARLESVADEARARGVDVAVILGEMEGGELEAVNFVHYRLHLDDRYRFVNPAQGPAPTGPVPDPRPAITYGDLIDRLGDPGAIPNFCGNIYLVPPWLESAFLAKTSEAGARCGGLLDHRILPW